MGRPTDYTEQLADSICERIALGESLRAICRDEDTPAMSSVFKWLNAYKEFSEQYARAREEQAETLADEIVSIADEEETRVRDAEVVFDSVAVARNRLRVDARKWVASKLKPKKYGDKQTTEVTGKDGGAIQTEGKLDVTGLNDDQLRAIASISIKPE